MSMNLSLSSFAGLLRRSGLMDSVRIDQLVADYRERAGDATNGTEFASQLVQQGQLTTWQARKLLQGKTKGFRLGKYRLLSQLGKGGMSTVYLAEHLVMRRQCAVKVLPTKQTRDPSALGRFHREAQAVAALDHPNIVRAYDVDQETEAGTEIHFLVMEYVEGANLQQVVEEKGPLPLPVAVDYIMQAAAGLSHAHVAGLIHRDIKPTNLLVDNQGVVKLLDLGLARFFDESDQESLTIDHNQKVLGTADYLSPEQAVDSHRVDARADIYSLGCTFYYLLSGQAPFPEGTLAQRLLAHQTREPAPITNFRKDLPLGVIGLLERMMAKNPDQRFSSAKELLQAFGEQFPELRNATVRSNIQRTQRASEREQPRRPAAVQNKPRSIPTGTAVAQVEPQLEGFLKQLHAESTQTTPSRQRAKRPSTASQGPAPVLDLLPADTAVSTTESELVVTDSALIAGESSSASMRRRAAQSRRSLFFVTCVAVGIATIFAVIGFLLEQLPDPSGSAPSVASASQPAKPRPMSGGAGIAARRGPLSTGAAAVVRPVPMPREDLTVGPTGHFATIREALDHVRLTHNPMTKRETQIIRVAGGAKYPESIVLDNTQFGTIPRGVELICEDHPPAILAPPHQQPAVELYGVEGFRLKGFRIEAPGPVAIRLGGYLVGLTLEDLQVSGFTSLGLEGKGVTGFSNVDRVTLRNMAFRPGSPSAAGIRLVEGTTPTKEILVLKCRFIGAMNAGIEFQDDVSGVEVRECLFDNLDRAISFGPSTADISDIVLRNNTFHRLQRGIVFAPRTSLQSVGVAFDRNLFASLAGGEAVIEEPRAENWQRMFEQALGSSRWNWTQRAEPGNPELGELDLFRQDGRTHVSVPFASEDPDQPGYLRPTLKDVRTAIPRDTKGPKQVGALPPSVGD